MRSSSAAGRRERRRCARRLGRSAARQRRLREQPLPVQGRDPADPERARGRPVLGQRRIRNRRATRAVISARFRATSARRTRATTSTGVADSAETPPSSSWYPVRPVVALDARVSPSDDVDRGLLFMAYMTSITDQFEFVIKNWVTTRLQGTRRRRRPAPRPVAGRTAARRRRTFNVRVGDTTIPADGAGGLGHPDRRRLLLFAVDLRAEERPR